MRRTQLFLDEDLWEMLHARARVEKTSISDLARRAIREKYAPDREQRRKAMMGIIGIWADRDDIGDSTEYVRELRRDNGRAARLR